MFIGIFLQLHCFLICLSHCVCLCKNQQEGEKEGDNLLNVHVSVKILFLQYSNLIFNMYVFSRVTSRWGSSVQHSYRKHPGCREARGGVFQNEKCKHSNPYEIFEVWTFGLTLSYKYWVSSLTFCPFSLLQMFQVIQPERALYIQANNCVEARDWIDILTKVSQCNRKRLSTYHPSAYLNGHWLCCKLSADTAPGCTPCTGYVRLLKSIEH